MRMLVTGHAGQVALSLAERNTNPDIEVVRLGRPELDLERPGTIGSVIAARKPDIIVSAAAYTAVDKAESESERAFAVNAKAPGLIGKIARELSVPVIHLSTDYVFSGSKLSPYNEEDPTVPLSIYGRSKLEGERALADATANHVILRTAWLYSPFGSNFVKTMLKVAVDRDSISVVSDQFGSPTSTLDLADAILSVATQLQNDSSSERLHGVFHAVASGEGTWADLAEAVFRASEKQGGPTAKVVRILAAQYRTAATRPANSRLATRKIQDTFGISLPPWRQSLDGVVQRLVEERSWSQ